MSRLSGVSYLVICTYTYIYIYTHMCTYEQRYTYIYIYIYIYIHTSNNDNDNDCESDPGLELCIRFHALDDLAQKAAVRHRFPECRS